MADDVRQSIQDAMEHLVELRRIFHAMPELGLVEHQTAARIAEELLAIGLTVQTEVGVTGVVGVLETGRPGQTLMIRADIDGLPIDELTGLPFASSNGRMHACGHDGHITMVLGAARILAERKDALMGRTVFVFQPAEEITSGAVEMLDDGLYDDYPPDRVIGLHLWNQIPMGEIGVNRGTVFASADAIRVKVRGRGGHGALPHLSVDPVVAAAQIITAAQTVVSREVPPNDMGVLTFGQIHGGTTFNVIPDEVIIEGTIRAYTPEIRTVIFDATTRIVEEMGKALRVEATFERVFGTPAVINDPETASWVASQAMQVVGEDAVGEVDPVSVGDDMAEFVNRAPGCYFLLGAAKEGAEGHHNAKFDFDEACLPIGTEIFVRAAVDMLGG